MLAHEEHLDDVLTGRRCLVAVRWLFENGYGAPEEYPEVAVLRSLT